ncbi:MAG: hypothetical protein HPY50_10385 [Firmicutes bacterium]|nr:hypothetical protein [Bacillota bacterium]
MMIALSFLIVIGIGAVECRNLFRDRKWLAMAVFWLLLSVGLFFIVINSSSLTPFRISEVTDNMFRPVYSMIKELLGRF